MTNQIQSRQGVNRKVIFAGVVVAALAITAFIVAEITGSSQIWRMALSAQLHGEKRCRIDELIATPPNGEQTGAPVIKGRAKCIDGRDFKFTRGDPAQPFTFKLCKDSNC